MKIFEHSPITGEAGPVHLNDRLKGVWQFGLVWNKDLQAQEVLINALAKVLDGKHTLLRNLTLPGLMMSVPIILISPSGIRSIYTSSMKGIFQIKDEGWYALDSGSKKYVPSRPNLIRRTLIMARATYGYLSNLGYPIQEVQPVLFLAEPGIHVESDHPAVRILQADGIDHLVKDILQSPAVLNSLDIERLVEALNKARPAPPPTSPRKTTAQPVQKQVAFAGFKMQSWQWLVVGFLAFLLLMVLIALGYAMLTGF